MEIKNTDCFRKRTQTMAYYCIAVLTVTLSVSACSASLICYNCSGATNMDGCQEEVSCRENEVCFKKERYSGTVSYDLGCIPSKKCGKFADISGIDNDKGQTQSCFECCSSDGCNINLCEYKDPSLCVDDDGIDCAFYDSLFSICQNVNQAKKVCPKYCKLCQVVDGHWTPWSNWSDCDFTCENGTQLRTRSCSDPEPQYGGLDCLGNDTETQLCHREPCPIHGGWSSWSTWSECSVSCDIGMQHRDRLCTNPSPRLFRDHCFGSDEQYRICMPGACADGGWSSWGLWGACSESCEGGIMSRTRACSNPAPSMIGKQCVGNSEQVRLCNKHACKDGGWSNWGSWGTCSVSCTGGIMSRYRACSNPVPSVSGKQCMGNSEQVRQCNKQACPEYCKPNPCIHGSCVSNKANYTCICPDTYVGQRCEIEINDCYDIFHKKIGNTSGIYSVKLWRSKQTINVYCDMDTHPYGWTVFQNRFNGSVDFYRNFSEYTNGFGNLHGEFWLGLNYIQEMTSQYENELRMDLTAANLSHVHEIFMNFSLAIYPKFTLHLGQHTVQQIKYASNHGMQHAKGADFSTFDRDEDKVSRDCARHYHGGWWYCNCAYANLNGEYVTPPGGTSSYDRGWGGFIYYEWTKLSTLKASKMMFRKHT